MNTHKTRAALTCGAIAGPLFTVAGLTQAATRAGFDPAKHQLSLVSTGSAGAVGSVWFIASALAAYIWASAVAAHLRPASRRGTTGQALRRRAGVPAVALETADPH